MIVQVKPKHIFSVLFLVSCSFNDEVHQFISPDLEVYVNSYKQYALDRGVDHRINWYDISIIVDEAEDYGRPRNSMGVGGLWNGRRIVVVDEDYFETVSDDLLELIVIHELGHALWNYKHGDNFIMRKSPDEQEYVRNKDKYLNEFFEQAVRVNF